jgi:mono/diheme cytochrome c family protein
MADAVGVASRCRKRRLCHKIDRPMLSPFGCAADSPGRRMCCMSALGRKLRSLIIVMALTGGTAQAQQDLDRGKSGAQLFRDNCANCHRSPRGLVKDRFSWTLSSFLQQHYASSSASAQALTAYLQSVDPPRARPQRAARTPRPMSTDAWAPPRPPAPVPVR